MAVVGAPSCFARRPRPKTPRELTAHDCIDMRLPTHGGLSAWEFEKAGTERKLRVGGQVVFDTIALKLQAAPGGLGLACLPGDVVQTQIAEGRLIGELADWCPTFPGHHLQSPAGSRTGGRPAAGWTRR